MPEIMITVKGFFALAQDYEEQAVELVMTQSAADPKFTPKHKALKDAASRCRNSAYQLLGVPALDKDQRHMGEVMADF